MAKKIILLLFLCISTNIYSQSIHSYVAKHHEYAQQLMKETQIPASLILGIAIHESAYGKSKIARILHNHFGIKGKNRNKKLHSAYKSYDSTYDSYRHFTQIISRKPYFPELIGKPVEKWTYRIHKTYASSNTWAKQVIGIIRKANLKKYDEELNIIKPTTDSVSNQELNNSIQPAYHMVEPGDTLYEIAKKYNTTVKELKFKNHLKSSKISIGKRLEL